MKFTFSLLCIVMMAATVRAQDLQFRKLTSNQGMSHNTVYAITQDEKGQMWFATREGLDRYDSYEIKSYYIKDSLPGVSPDKIAALLSDRDSLYVATEEGLYIYNMQTDRIVRSDALSGDFSVLCLMKAGRSVYAGTSEGLFRIAEGRSKLITPRGLAVVAMEVLAPGRLLVKVGSQLRIIDEDGNIMSILDVRHFPELGNSNFDIYQMYRDPHGLVWLCTNYGLYHYDVDAGTLRQLHFANTESKEANTVRAVALSKDDLLYIGTEDGLYTYDRRTGVSQNYGQSFDNSPQKLNDKAIYSTFIAKDGSVWLGTYFGGVNYIPSTTYAFQRIMPRDDGRGLSGKAVSQMMEDSDKNIWIGTEDGGITIYNPAKDSYRYIGQTTQPFYLSINNVHAIHDDGYGHIWVGTFLGGLHEFDLKRRTTTVYTHRAGDPGSISGDNVYAVFRDSRGVLWVGTQNGINIFDYQKKNFTHFRPEVFGSKFIYDITEDHNGDIWFCTRYNGIYRYNPDAGTLNHYSANGRSPGLTSNQVISTYKDSDRHLWFGTLGGGMLQFDFSTDRFKSYTTADGLANNNVYGMIIDTAGYAWLTTNQGLSKYDFKTKRFINYSNKYGLPSNQFNFKSFLKASDGTLYFGSINGLLTFKPGQISSNMPQVPLIFTDFQLFNKTVEPGQDAILSRQIDFTSDIELSYNQNVFTINYAAIDYANPGSTRYSYYLKGFEEQWNYVGSKNSATYTNLSPGEYTFYVVALNADDTPKSIGRSLHITVRPPFYQTRLAYLFYFLILLLLIWLYTRLIRFLHKKKTEVQIERIEKEKTKELTQNRLNFFTYVTHEFKTPLTLILAAIEKLTAENKAVVRKNAELTSIKKSASVLFKLIQQLMEFRKMETGHDSVDLSYLDLIEYLRATTTDFETIAQSKGTELAFNTQLLGLPCYFDKDKVEKIYFNILSNAIKNTDQGHITVTVRQLELDETLLPGQQSSEDASTHQGIEIRVEDTGRGMTKKELKSIFNPFYRSTVDEEGSGIGLALVKSLVQYLNGRIEIDSEPQKGTTVLIVLPVVLHPKSSAVRKKASRRVVDGTKAQETMLPDPPPLPQRDDLKKYKLLIVEDNKELMVFLTNHFSTYYNTVSAANGAVALKKIEKGAPDIIISDVKMPKMDGIALSRHIKNDPRFSYIPIILLSEWGSDDKRVSGLDTGADAYLGKPFNLKELELLVSNMIASRVKLREHVISISELAIDNLPTNNKHQEFLTKLSSLLEERFADADFTIEQMANELNMSRTSLHLNLKKIVNKSASVLLNEYRLKRAAVMLENDMPINETAYACGYNDPNYFSRVFKKHYGQTPASYRDGAKQTGLTSASEI